MARRNDLRALRNMIAEAQQILTTTNLPEGRAQRANELLASAVFLADHLLEVSPAAKRGPEYFRKIAAMRKERKGGRKLMDAKMRGLRCERIQSDEIWTFVGKKQRQVQWDDPEQMGDAWVFVAIDADTKLIPAYTVGKRDRASTNRFLLNLHDRLAPEHRFQLTTDGFHFYQAACALHFAYYNFCRIHRTLRVTPAMEAGITDHIFTLRELLSTQF